MVKSNNKLTHKQQSNTTNKSGAQIFQALCNPKQQELATDETLSEVLAAVQMTLRASQGALSPWQPPPSFGCESCYGPTQ